MPSANAGDRVPVIQTHALGKVYSAGTEAEVVALKGVDMRVNRGDFVAIMGPSGSGKSTLMNLIGCLDTPTDGRYLCDGIDVATLDAEQLAILRREKIGFVFQSFQLLPRLNAIENVELPLIYAGVGASERHRRATELLTRMGLGDKLRNLPTQLSGGQQQRVAIARALINGPSVLLADEPTGALDQKTGAQVMELFGEIHAEGKTIVMITHEPEIAQHAERIVTILDGYLTETDKVAAIAPTHDWASAAHQPSHAAPTEDASLQQEGRS